MVVKDEINIAVDLQYEDFMSDKELGHLAMQLCRIYGSNSQHANPVHLSFVNLLPRTLKVCQEKNDGFVNYIMHQTPKPLLEEFAKEDVVYLTPDSERTLDKLENGIVYVIGGLVDETVQKKRSLDVANANGLRTAKLPIDSLMSRGTAGTFKQILTVNQVFNILLNLRDGQDWIQALSHEVPKRTGFKPVEH